MLWWKSSARTYTTGHRQYILYTSAFVARTRWTRKRDRKVHLLFERKPLFHRQAVRLGDDRHYVHNLAQLLQHDNVNRTQRMTGGVNEEQRAVNSGVLDVAVSHRRQLFSEVRAVLVLDVFDDRVPTEKGKA